jgi:pseudaminic acid cytidylyltransferase
MDIVTGLNLLVENNSQLAFTVTSFPFPIQRAIKINKNGRVEMFQPGNFMTRSQDLEAAYHDAGQFYWAKTDAVLNDVLAFSKEAVPVILPRHRVQDIDTYEDWARAELLFQLMSIQEQDK